MAINKHFTRWWTRYVYIKNDNVHGTGEEGTFHVDFDKILR